MQLLGGIAVYRQQALAVFCLVRRRLEGLFIFSSLPFSLKFFKFDFESVSMIVRNNSLQD